MLGLTPVPRPTICLEGLLGPLGDIARGNHSTDPSVSPSQLPPFVPAAVAAPRTTMSATFRIVEDAPGLANGAPADLRESRLLLAANDTAADGGPVAGGPPPEPPTISAASSSSGSSAAAAAPCQAPEQTEHLLAAALTPSLLIVACVLAVCALRACRTLRARRGGHPHWLDLHFPFLHRGGGYELADDVDRASQITMFLIRKGERSTRSSSGGASLPPPQWKAAPFS